MILSKKKKKCMNNFSCLYRLEDILFFSVWLHYLKGTLGLGLLYKPLLFIYVTGFSNFDYASSHFDRRPIFGYCTFVGDYLVT